jgi:hypothetical protein
MDARAAKRQLPTCLAGCLRDTQSGRCDRPARVRADMNGRDNPTVVAEACRCTHLASRGKEQVRRECGCCLPRSVQEQRFEVGGTPATSILLGQCTSVKVNGAVHGRAYLHKQQVRFRVDGNEKEYHKMVILRIKAAHTCPQACWEASPTSRSSLAHRVILAARHQ